MRPQSGVAAGSATLMPDTRIPSLRLGQPTDRRIVLGRQPQHVLAELVPLEQPCGEPKEGSKSAVAEEQSLRRVTHESDQFPLELRALGLVVDADPVLGQRYPRLQVLLWVSAVV